VSLAEFKIAPWRTSHSVYRGSALAISPAPEYASAEVLLASLYRTIGLQGVSDLTVPQRGRELDRSVLNFRERDARPAGAALDAETFHTMLHAVLESPKLPNQSSKRFLQVAPLVPRAALFSGSARLSSNSWPAGDLVRRMVWLGSDCHEDATAAWSELFSALGVAANDDIFGRFLEQEIGAWADGPPWSAIAPEEKDVALMTPSDLQDVQFPARQFVRDITALVSAKNSMTRRQWTSLLEAIVRLAAVAHVTWLCDVHARVWRILQRLFEGGDAPGEDRVRSEMFPHEMAYLYYGDKALPGIADRASAYLAARLGINSLLWTLEAAKVPFSGSLSSSSDVALLSTHVCTHRDALAAAKLKATIDEVNEREQRALLCRKGIGSNVLEFARHVLGQRQAANSALRGYDQGYVLKKRSLSANSPWIVSLGPVSALSLVHCSLAGMRGPRSVHRLSQHLAAYGVVVDRRDIAQNDLGHQLRMLGLVLDSPDAESGMLLVPPFPSRRSTTGASVA
jgi:hypothetical protein